MVSQKKMMNQQHKLARLRYQCRRGMLELDVFLPAFFDHCFNDLNDEEQFLFEEFLTEPDPDLFAWLMGFDAANEKYQSLVSKIRDFQSNRKNSSI